MRRCLEANFTRWRLCNDVRNRCFRCTMLRLLNASNAASSHPVCCALDCFCPVKQRLGPDTIVTNFTQDEALHRALQDNGRNSAITSNRSSER